ncbi:unnamed protein product [Rhizophagus irregularis]|nr:unnamed protein product [Rhizophagus irregularis]
MGIIVIEGQHFRIEFSYDIYIELLHRFGDPEGLIATLNHISDTGSVNHIMETASTRIRVICLSIGESEMLEHTGGQVDMWISLWMTTGVGQSSYYGMVKMRLAIRVASLLTLQILQIVEDKELIFYV